jgi:hypothetical protein
MARGRASRRRREQTGQGPPTDATLPPDPYRPTASQLNPFVIIFGTRPIFLTKANFRVSLYCSLSCFGATRLEMDPNRSFIQPQIPRKRSLLAPLGKTAMITLRRTKTFSKTCTTKPMKITAMDLSWRATNLKYMLRNFADFTPSTNLPLPRRTVGPQSHLIGLSFRTLNA